LQAVVRDRPSLAQAWGLLGTVHVSRRELPQAEQAYRRAVKLDATNPDFKYNLGGVLFAEKSYAGAAEVLAKATAMRRQHAPGWHMLGEARFHMGDLEAAVSCYERAISLAPNLMESYIGLARSYNYQGDFISKRRVLEAAVERRQDMEEINYALASTLLMLKEWAPGWRYYVCRPSARRKVPAPEDFRLEVKGRRLVIMTDQGLGDELFFLRFLPRLLGKGAEVVYHTPEKLYPLFKGNPLFADVVVAEENKETECDLLVGDLPLVTQMHSDQDVPPPFRLEAEASRIDALRAKLAAFGPGPYIGLTWQGGTRDAGKALFKEIPPQELGSSLAGLPGSFVMLQRNPVKADVQAMQAGLGRAMLDMSSLNDDLQDMLALLSLLDEYVGVSNTNMHLLAGLGKTGRVLVPFPSEWRWLAEGDTSPWFPGFKVYRQLPDHSWADALSGLSQDLRDKYHLLERPQ
jgi:tetratricopeptide (TPR) repeat protein